MGLVDVASEWGKTAGIAGMAMGLVLLIFRQIINKDIFPQLPARQATRILSLLIVLTFAIAVLGIGAWLYSNSSTDRQKAAIFDMLVTQAQAATAQESGALKKGQSYASQELPQQMERFTAVLAKMRSVLSSQSSLSRVNEIDAALRRGSTDLAVQELRSIAKNSEQTAATARGVAAELLEFSGKFDEAIAEYAEAANSSSSGSSDLSKAVSLALNTGRHEIADSLIEQHRSNAIRNGASDYDLAHYTALKGIALWFQGKNLESKAAFDSALPLLRTRNTAFLAEVLNDSSAVYDSIGQVNDARSRLAEAERIWRCLGPTHKWEKRVTDYNLAAQLIREGRYSQARSVMSSTKIGDDANDWVDQVRRWALLGSISLHTGEWSSASSAYEAARKVLIAHRQTGGYRYGRVLRFLGVSLLEQGKFKEAERFLDQSLGVAQSIFGRNGQETLILRSLLSLVDAENGNASVATKTNAGIEEIFPAESKESVEYALVLNVDARIRVKGGDLSGAINQMQRSCLILESNTYAPPVHLLHCRERLRDYLLSAARQQEANVLASLLDKSRVLVEKRANELLPGIIEPCVA